ncbi:hypothetical protein SK128_023295, partial [Halocaridina rubra]
NSLGSKTRKSNFGGQQQKRAEKLIGQHWGHKCATQHYGAKENVGNHLITKVINQTNQIISNECGQQSSIP